MILRLRLIIEEKEMDKRNSILFFLLEWRESFIQFRPEYNSLQYK